MESIRSRRGFTLIELIVVLAIIVVISMVVITSQGSFNKTLVLANTAYDIALTIRSAETHGLGSKALGTTVNAGYGMHFQNGVGNSFILFADTSPTVSTCHTTPLNDSSAPNAQTGDCVYTEGGDIKISTYALGNSIVVSDFCATYASGSTLCASNIGTLDIIFARPNPNPFMSAGGTYYDPVSYPSQQITKACLTISSLQDLVTHQYISIASSGQINASATSCP